MSSSPLIWADDLAAPMAWKDGLPISRHQYLADVSDGRVRGEPPRLGREEVVARQAPH